jgi:hypothetical protein
LTQRRHGKKQQSDHVRPQVPRPDMDRGTLDGGRNPQDDVIRARAFQQRLFRYIRRFSPDAFIPLLAERISAATTDQSLWRYYPLHRLLHMAEACCAYYDGHSSSDPMEHDFRHLVNLYQDFREPAPKYFLTPPHKFDLLQHYFARQQFPPQQVPNGMDMTRAALIFDDSLYPRSLPSVREQCGIGFADWINLCFLAWSVIESWDSQVFQADRLLNVLAQVSTPQVARSAFQRLSRTTQEIGASFHAKRQTDHDWLFDLGLPCGFETWPLLRLRGQQVVAVHRPYVFFRGLEGPYDLGYECAQTSFGNEIGQAYEKYIGRVLLDLPGVTVLRERDLAPFVDEGEELCDYAVVDDTSVMLVETKAVKFTNDKATVNAVRDTNATRKLAKGISQLAFTAKLLNDGRFESVIGSAAGRQRLGAVVTFGPLYANDDGFWRDAIEPHLANEVRDIVASTFAHRPQVMDTSGFEYLVGISRVQDRSVDQIFAEKLALPYIQTGEWNAYLRSHVSSDTQPTCWAGVLSRLFEPYLERMAVGAEPRSGARGE